jgi:hypothetical protein
VRLWPLRGPPGAEGIQALTRSGQRTGSSGRTPGSSPDRQGVSRSSGSSNGSRRTRRSQKAGDGYLGRHVVSWAGQVDGAGSREDPLEFGALRKVRSTDPSPDLASCSGVYENTCRITRERLVGGIANWKGQASRGPGPGHVIGSHSAEELLAGARLGLASDVRVRPIKAWSGIRCTSFHFSFSVTTGASSSSYQQLPFIRGDRSSSVASRFCWSFDLSVLRYFTSCSSIFFHYPCFCLWSTHLYPFHMHAFLSFSSIGISSNC